MNLFSIQIISPEGTIWSGSVESVQALGIDGLFGVMANHRPMIAALVPGPLKIHWDGDKFRHYAIGEGILEVRTDKRVVLLVDYAESCETVDEAKVKAQELLDLL